MGHPVSRVEGGMPMPALFQKVTFGVAITFVLVMGLRASSDDPTDGTWDLDAVTGNPRACRDDRTGT
jgi:hypothetical protein